MYKGKAPDGLEEGFIQLLAFDFPFNFCLLEPPPHHGSPQNQQDISSSSVRSPNLR